MWQRFKKCAAVLLVLAMAAIAAGPTQTAKAADEKINFIVKLDSTNVTSGDIITAQVWLAEGNTAVNSIAGTVTFDTNAFSYVNASAVEGELITSSNGKITGDLGAENASDGYLTVFVTSLDDETYFMGPQHLYTIKFRVKYGTATSGTGTIDFGMAEALSVALDSDGNVVKGEDGKIETEKVENSSTNDTSDTTVTDLKDNPIPDAGITITWKDGMLGDVDLDKEVTAGDATMTLGAYLGKLQLTDDQKILADVDADGEITAGDATMILGVFLNKITL